MVLPKREKLLVSCSQKAAKLVKVNAMATSKTEAGVARSLKKAGFYEAGKDTSKRLSIINKVTTKPQRVKIVDKLFLAKKVKGAKK
jgi:hypothetical protein